MSIVFYSLIWRVVQNSLWDQTSSDDRRLICDNLLWPSPFWNPAYTPGGPRDWNSGLLTAMIILLSSSPIEQYSIEGRGQA